MESSTLTTKEQSVPELQRTNSPHHLTTNGGMELSLEEQKQLRLTLIQTEAPALYGDNNNRVTQRNYLLLGIFIAFSPMLSLAMQNDSRHHYALAYNIIIFFLMLLWAGNTEKMGRQNGEILGLEKCAKYRGIQTIRATQRQEGRVIIVPQKAVFLVGTSTITIPNFLAVRWGKQYWGTVGLLLSTDCIMLYLSGMGRDLLSIIAVLFTLAIPVFITHERPAEKPLVEENEKSEAITNEE